jgi:hypothetical protein
MEFLINESQLKIILTEEQSSRLTESIKVMNNYTVNLVKQLKTFYGLNFKMLMTWGASVGGLMMPLDNFIKSGNFNLNEREEILIIGAVASILFTENEKNITTLLKKIKEDGLTDVFQVVLNKGEELKSSFVDFLKSLKISIGSFMEMTAYAFLIPILFDILSIADQSTSIRQGSLLVAERIIASGLVFISKEAIYNLIRKIIKRVS